MGCGKCEIVLGVHNAANQTPLAVTNHKDLFDIPRN